MPLLTFFIYHRFTSHITMSGTAAVNILMSFIALLFALLVQYVNDRFNWWRTFNDWLSPILNFSLCGE